MFHSGSRARLGWRDKERFPESTLFARLARTVCDANCLPRKELFESWELARRIRRRLRGGRVVDLACGHGLLAFALLLLDRDSTEAVAVDSNLPRSAERLHTALAATWPEVAERLRYVEGALESIELAAGDLVVAAHACGPLTDRVLERACAARARIGVLPCCHALGRRAASGLEGWLGGSLAQDVARAHELERAGYRVHAQSIPEEITPRNRVLIAWPHTFSSTDHQSERERSAPRAAIARTNVTT